MSRSTKPRGDSLGARLTPEQRTELLVMLIDQRCSYDVALKWLEAQGVKSSLGAVANFYQGERTPFITGRAKHVLKDVMLPAELDEAEQRVIKQRMFELATSSEVSEKGLLKMRDQHIKLAQLELARRRIVLLEKKLAEVDALTEQTTLSAEEQRARLKEILK